MTLPDIKILDSGVYPESVTSAVDGSIFVGSVKGNVYRAEPGANTASAWIRATPGNGIQTIFGVLADDASNTLWLCSVPNFLGGKRSQAVSSLMAFDLNTAGQKGTYPLPPPAAVCNDITIAADGTAFISDTSNGRIFTLAPGTDKLELYGEDKSLVGIDGLVFSGDGTLYVNNVRSNKLMRVETNSDGSMAGLTTLTVSHELGGPDGFRLIKGNRFLLAEGSIGRLSIVTIEGENATLTVLDDTLESTPGVTLVRDTAYVIESNIKYLLNPDFKGQQPDAFMIYARKMPAD